MSSSNYQIQFDGMVSGGGNASSDKYSNNGMAGLMVATGAIGPQLTDIIHGDVNGDSAINVFDALLTLQYSVGLIVRTPEADSKYLTYADVAPLDANGKPKGDGVVNVFDALAILRKSVGLDTW